MHPHSSSEDDSRSSPPPASSSPARMNLTSPPSIPPGLTPILCISPSSTPPSEVSASPPSRTANASLTAPGNSQLHKRANASPFLAADGSGSRRSPNPHAFAQATAMMQQQQQQQQPPRTSGAPSLSRQLVAGPRSQDALECTDVSRSAASRPWILLLTALVIVLLSFAGFQSSLAPSLFTTVDLAKLVPTVSKARSDEGALRGAVLNVMLDASRPVSAGAVGWWANTTDIGLHVPCSWIEQHFGGAQRLEALKAAVRNVTLQVDAAALSVAVAAPAGPTSGWQLSEHVEVAALLDSAGIFCGRLSLQRACGTLAPPLSSAALQALHAWQSSLPVEQVYENLLSFTSFNGAVASLACRAQTRYGAPFAADFAPSLYVAPDTHVVPADYSRFVQQCHADSKSPDAPSKSPEQPHAQADTLSLLSQPAAASPHLPAWAQQLFPQLPSVCSLSAFTRPSLARACLRNQRVLGLGDSTLQELLLQLIDFLETPDGEDENDLTRRAITHQTPQEDEHAPLRWRHDSERAGSNETIYYWLEIWAAPNTCKYGTSPAPHWESRVFSTAYFPTPYLAAYNITVAMRWNVEVAACDNFRGIDAPSETRMIAAAYSLLRDSCLPADAVAVANAYRRRADGSWRSPAEYVAHINALFPNMVKRFEGANRPGFGCHAAGYLDDETVARFSRADWAAHLAAQPVLRASHSLLCMGAHYVAQFNNPAKQTEESAPYPWTPSQWSQAVSRAVRTASWMAQSTLVVEMPWRDDGRKVITEQFEGIRHATREAVRELAMERQQVRRQRMMAMAAQPQAHSITADAALSSLTSLAAPAASLPLPPSVRYLPRASLTIRMPKRDRDHCSAKGFNFGFGDRGMRTPFCFDIVQHMIHAMCGSTQAEMDHLVV